MAEEAARKEEESLPRRLGELWEFHDVPYEVTIVIGRTSMTIGDLLQLSRGSMVELTKSAGESFDVHANGRLIARGDVTVIDDRFAIRVTECVKTEREGS